MANVTGIDLNPILQRLNSTSNYHPFDAETFSDWATEAGDIVSISRNGETYVSPVHTSRMVWKGKAPTMQISTTGNEKRDAVSRVSRKKYGRGSAGIRSQEGIHRNFVSEDGILHSELHITESYLRTEFHDETNSLRSEFDMTASHLRTEFLDEVHSLRSEFEVTASHLRTEFEDDVNSLRGEFEVTASHLRTDFEDNINSLRGEFEVTASHLRTEFTDEVHSLRGELEVTASHLRTEFEDDVNSVRSYMHQTASSWEARVEGVTDANGNITAASIAVAVNAEGSQARINADRIYLLGQTIIDTVTADYIEGKIANIPTLRGIAGVFSGNLSCSAMMAEQVYVGSGTSYTNISDGIAEVQVTGPTNNIYKLQYKKFSDHTWQDAGTFSRATTLSGAWSGRNYTVTASPQGNIKAGTVYETIVPDTSDSVAYNANTKQLSRLYYVYSEDENGDADSVILHKTVSIPGDLAYAAGYTDGSASGGSTTLTNAWSGGKITVTANPQGATLERQLQAGAATWNGTRVTIPIKSVYGNSGQYSEGIVFDPFVDVSGKLQDKTISSNGTVTPDAGYIGFGSVTVAVPTTNASARFGAGDGSYFIEAYDRTSGTSITGSSVTYKLAKSGNKVQIQNTSSVQLSNTPEYDMSTDLTNAGYSGRANVTLNDPTWNPVTGATPTYRTVTVATSGRTNASGTTDNLSKSVALYLTQGSWSSNQLTVFMRAGGTSGTVYASTTVDASTLVSNATTAGYKAGWEAYYNKWWYPVVGTSAGMTVNWPSKTVDSAYDSISRTYTIQNKDNNTVYLRYNNQTYAEFAHNKHTAGYNSAKLTLNTSTKKVTKTSSGSVNEYTLALIQDTMNTTSGNNYGTRKVWIKATPDNGNSFEVSNTTLSDYRTGWTAAANMVSVPTAAGTNAYVTVTYPPSTVGGSKSSYSYYVTADDSMAYIRAGSSSGTIVARASHSAYNNGYDKGYSKGVDDYYGDYIVPVFSERYQDNYNGNQYKTSGGTFIRKIHASANTGIHIPLSEDGANAGSANLTEIPSGGITANGNYKFRSGYAGIRYLKVAVPTSTSHSVSVSSQNIWHGQSRADVLDRMGISSFSNEWGIGSGSPYWGFKASCGGSTKNFLVYRA